MLKDQSAPINLIQYLRQNSQLSRRELLQCIINGDVKVNDIIIADSLHLVCTTDKVTLNNTVINAQQFSYYQFNKPIGVLSTMDDPNQRLNLKSFLNRFKLPHTLKPCGRLDKDSSGLLLFSNNGNFIHTILHPSFHVPKTYQIKLSHPLSHHHKDQLSAGIFLDDGPVSLTFKQTISPIEFIVEISIGRNRIIRRAFDYFDYSVRLLHRLSIGSFELNNQSFGTFSPILESQVQAFYESYSL